jgi:hypothetical protein
MIRQKQNEEKLLGAKMTIKPCFHKTSEQLPVVLVITTFRDQNILKLLFLGKDLVFPPCHYRLG